MTTRRQEVIGVLLAAAAFATALGARYDVLWFWLAGVLVAVSILWAASPVAGNVGYWTTFQRWRNQRRWLKDRKDGWEAGHIQTLAGTILVLSSAKGVPPLPGFLCEIQGPGGDFSALTPGAQQIASSKKRSARLSLPAADSSAVLLFPDDFEAVRHGPVPFHPFLPQGRYHVLWWAWKPGPRGLSVVLDFVTADCFEIGPGVGRSRDGLQRVREL